MTSVFDRRRSLLSIVEGGRPNQGVGHGEPSIPPRTPALDRLPWGDSPVVSAPATGGRGDAIAFGLGASGAAAAPELLVGDLLAEPDVEADAQSARQGDLGRGAAPPMPHGEVGPLELAIRPRGERGRLPPDPAQPRVALLGDSGRCGARVARDRKS